MVLLFVRTKELKNERFSNHPTGEERSPSVRRGIYGPSLPTLISQILIIFSIVVLLFVRTKVLKNERFSNHPTGEKRSPSVISLLGIGKMTLTELATMILR